MTNQEITPLSDSISFSDSNLGAFVENRFGDRYLYSINGNAFNGIGADSVYNARWGDKLFKENTLYIVAGSDSGVFIRYIQQRGIPEGSRYLIVEIPEVLPYVQEQVNAELLDTKKIHLCEAEQWLDEARKMSLSEYAYLDSVHLIRSIAVEDANLLAYSPFWRELDKGYQRVMWQYKVEFGNLTFITRHIENLGENRHSAYVLKDKFKGCTAVILAGGPSLDTMLPWIKQHQNELTLVAVSRISKRLLQVGLEPDIIVTVDPHRCSFDVSKHMLKFQHALLVNAYHATPFIMAQWPGKSLYLDRRYPWTQDKHETNIAGMGPTVSNSALNLMTAMGFSQVIFAGLDLCFSQEGFSHAKGSDERKTGAFVAYGGQTVKTNSGDIAETDNSFFNAVATIEKQAKTALECGTRFINPAPYAAAMEYVEYVPLDEIRIEHNGQSTREIIEQCLPLDDMQARIQIYEQTIKDLEQAEYKLTKLQNFANKALEHNEGLFGRNGKKKDFKHKLKMDRIEKSINRELQELANISKIFGMTKFVKTLRPDDSREWTDDEIEAAGKNYYEAYLFGSSQLLDIIRQQIQRLYSRIDELRDSPNFDALFQRWEDDKIPGRAVVWREQHAEHYQTLNQDLKDRFQQFADSFQKELDDNNHGYMAEIRQFAELKAVIAKVHEMSQHKDLAGLYRLLRGLATRKEDEAKHLHTLTKGYIAELEEDMQTAIDCLHQLIDLPVEEYPRIVENALIRLTVLSMNCGELGIASDCLKNLSAMSFTYLPHFAEILRISQKTQAAIDVYTEYLSMVQDDLASMMKLGMLYKTLGVNEGAHWIFDYVSKKDPENTAAKRLLQEMEKSA